jgi:AcrR family transcriptional regulator
MSTVDKLRYPGECPYQRCDYSLGVSTGPVGQSRDSDSGRGGRRRLSVQRRRDELIQVALDLYSRNPGHQVSIEDVADAAGASRALVYHYFGGKRGLQLAALGSAADQFTAALAPAAEAEQLRQLDALLGRYLDFVEGHAAGFAALQRSAATHRNDELGGHVHRVRQAMFEWLLAALGAVGAGTAARSPGSLRLTLWAWIGAVESAALDWLEAGATDRPRVQRLLAGYLVVMLRTAAAEDEALAGRLGPVLDDTARRLAN